jgi:hypothetical protein
MKAFLGEGDQRHHQLKPYYERHRYQMNCPIRSSEEDYEGHQLEVLRQHSPSGRRHH